MMNRGLLQLAGTLFLWPFGRTNPIDDLLHNKRQLEEIPTGYTLEDLRREKACKALQNGLPFETTQSMNIQYSYELLTDSEPIQVGYRVELAVKSHLDERLISGNCNGTGTMADQGTWTSDIRSISVGGTLVISLGECTEVSSPVGYTDLSCYQIVSSNTVHLDDDAEVNLPALRKIVAWEIRTAFENGNVELTSQDGILGFHFVATGNSYERENNEKEPSKDSDTEDSNKGGTKENGTSQSDEAPSSDSGMDLLTVVGALLISLAGIGALVALGYSLFRLDPDNSVPREELEYRDQLSLQVVLSGDDTSDSEDEPAEENPKTSEKSASLQDQPCKGNLDNRNPFAYRKGKTLSWTNINMTLSGKSKKNDRKILDDVWGGVPETQTTAIMGASGSGKTTLLNILSGRASSRGRVKVEGDIRLDDVQVNPKHMDVRKKIAFVAQDDSLQITSTPREAIRFSAKLRMPSSMTDEELDELTETMLTELGLTSCADTMIGGLMVKGISGGERKRTSVGVELVVKPSMVFLDEPTSGLDSFSAIQLCQVLKKVANAGASVLFTIHQPSSTIFREFDHLILLNSGRVMYRGPVSKVSAFFEERGYSCPATYNTADFILNVAHDKSVEELEDNGFFASCKNEEEQFLPQTPQSRISYGEGGQETLVCNVESDGNSLTGTLTSLQKPDPALIEQEIPATDHQQCGIVTQTSMLLHREIVNLARDKSAFLPRLFQTAVLATLIGIIFFQVGEESATDPSNIQSRFGAITICSAVALIYTGQASLIVFPEERPIFIREYSTNHYSVAAYFLSHLAIEAITSAVQMFILVVILFYMVSFQGSFLIFYASMYVLAMTGTALAAAVSAAVGGNSELALQFLIILFMPQLLFVGYFVIPSLIPTWIGWLQYICPAAYAVRIILVNEFWNCRPDNFVANLQCNALLDNVNANADDVWLYWVSMVSIFVGVRVIALVLLRANATRFY